MRMALPTSPIEPGITQRIANNNPPSRIPARKNGKDDLSKGFVKAISYWRYST
jgi:hypothetical protein